MPSYDYYAVVSGEQVWAVPDYVVDTLFPKPGYNKISEEQLETLEELAEHSIVFTRDGLEYNTMYRQVIPYCIITGPQGIFSMMRDKGDSRLTRLRSIGIGGHARLQDLIDGSGVVISLLCAADRELDEELFIPEMIDLAAIDGVIKMNDGINSVHLGIVIIYRVEANTLTPKEEDSFVPGESGFVSYDYLMENIDSYEPWSQAFIRNAKRGEYVR
jgi:predicted NUDIX family phosphoesterase